jgi:hypothetical protein
MAPYIAAFIDTPLYVMNSAFDAWVAFFRCTYTVPTSEPSLLLFPFHLADGRSELLHAVRFGAARLY